MATIYPACQFFIFVFICNRVKVNNLSNHKAVNLILLYATLLPFLFHELFRFVSVLNLAEKPALMI